MPNGNAMAPMGMPPGIPMGGAAPGPGPQGPGPNALAKPTMNAPQSGAFSVEQHVGQNWDQAQAQHKQLMAAQKRMNVARSMLDSLKKKGDQIQVEDVIEGAGTMVGAGFSPTALAQMLAQMPTTGGEALQAWVEQQDQRARQMDTQLQQKIQVSAVHKGITAMAALHVDHIKGEHSKAAGALPPQPSGVGGNALGPQMGTPSLPQGGDAGEED
jgi:hypothetical protein